MEKFETVIFTKISSIVVVMKNKSESAHENKPPKLEFIMRGVFLWS